MLSPPLFLTTAPGTTQYNGAESAVCVVSAKQSQIILANLLELTQYNLKNYFIFSLEDERLRILVSYSRLSHEYKLEWY